MMHLRYLVLTCGLLSTSLPAQQWRTLTAARHRQAVDTLHTHVNYNLGKLHLNAAPQSLVYQLRTRFNAEQARPLWSYDSTTHTLLIGPESTERKGHPVIESDSYTFNLGGSSHDHDEGELTLGLARGIPLDLTIRASATETVVDLTDLTVSSLHFNSVGSESRLTFGTPNPARIPRLDISVTAGEFTVSQLGNAHADVVHLAIRAGEATLDLSGTWTGQMMLDLNATMGSVTVRVPRDVGIQARVSKMFGGFDAPQLTERNGRFYSANWDKATRKVVIEGDAALAGIEIEWLK